MSRSTSTPHTRLSSNRQSAFTLVEVMVVLAILVLLLAMVGPRVLGTQKKADIKITTQQIQNLEAALKLYSVDARTFPSTEEGLKTLLQKPADETRAQNWAGPYLDEVDLPVDPWGQQFRYAYPPINGTLDFPNIWSSGPDSKENTEDDIVNWKKDATTDGNSTTAGSSTNPVSTN